MPGKRGSCWVAGTKKNSREGHKKRGEKISGDGWIGIKIRGIYKSMRFFLDQEHG